MTSKTFPIPGISLLLLKRNKSIFKFFDFLNSSLAILVSEMKTMKFTLVILLCVAGTSAFAQEREFPDYRSKKENFARIQEKDIRNDLASFAFGGMDESIGKGKLPSIPATKYGPDFISFNGGDIHVTITSGTFDESAHKYTYYNKEHLVKIDGRPFYGSYDELPETTIKSVVVIVNKDTVSIPVTAYNDLFNPEFTYTDKNGVVKSYNAVYLSPDKETFYIYMLNKKPKANYEVTWVIRKKQFIRRVVDFGFLK
jgi:hypothetical protein